MQKQKNQKKPPGVFSPIARLYILAAFLAGSIALCILLWQGDFLTADCGGKPLFAWPIKAGDCFELRFTHSLNLSPVTDTIEWTGEELIVRKSVFSSFGAGVPIPSDGIGTELVLRDGHYELLGIDKPMPRFSIVTQEIPAHTVFYNGMEARLVELAGQGRQIEISVKRMPIAARFLCN
jgi:hypothetical protein